MKIVGIICEYNPLHMGHKKQIDQIRAERPDAGIVCLMSGNFVQRGKPAIIDKGLRAKAAVQCGADLVLELPVTACLSSAEGFASAGVEILGHFCSELCFGAETADLALLQETASALLKDEFSQQLKNHLSGGLSFPAARQKALYDLGIDGSILETPNNILAVEYCKAILSQNSNMNPYPIHRGGSYHDLQADPGNPSATAVRALMWEEGAWQDYVPLCAGASFEGASLHALKYGEKAILYRLRTMTDEEFEALPYGSEGLWRKLMHNARHFATLEEIIENTKSKRYTRTRLDRMIMCAHLGITKELLERRQPYTRVLAMNTAGRSILNTARKFGQFPNIGQEMDSPYEALETKWDDLYALFSQINEPSGQHKKRRVYLK